MRINAAGRAAAIAFLYIAAFVLIVVIQFPSTGPITAVAGGASFKGLPAGDSEASGAIRSAEIAASGLRLVFSDRSPLVYTDAAGKEHRSTPVSWEARESGFVVRFEDGSTVGVSVDASGRSTWSVKPRVRATAASARYELVRGASFLAAEEKGSLRLTMGGLTYRGSGSISAVGDGLITLSAVRGELKPFYLAADEAASQSQFMAQAPMEASAWQAVIGAWQDKAWYGLSGSAFDAAAGAWTLAGPAGTPAAPAFDEDSFLAYMAEALRRDRRDSAAALVAVVREAHAGKLGYRSVPYAGKTAATMARFEASNLAEIKAIERQVQARSADVFYIDDIVPFLFDRAPYSLAQAAVALAATLDFSKADVGQAVRVVEAYLDARAYLPDDENPFAEAQDLVDRIVASAIRKADGAFFLETGPGGVCDAAENLAAGKALLALADAAGKPIYAGIGQSLIAGFLGLAADDGSLPASVTVKDGTASPSDRRLSAGRAYAYVGASPYYPRAVSFYKELGPGAWALTCAPGLRVTQTPDKVQFFADYPVGSSHYLALYGVKPFVKIQLYGLDYKMASDFEIYNASGYFYKRDSGALYLKMRHKATTEIVGLFY